MDEKTGKEIPKNYLNFCSVLMHIYMFNNRQRREESIKKKSIKLNLLRQQQQTIHTVKTR